MSRQDEAGCWNDERVAAALSSAKSKLESVRNKLREPLAVIGMGCRFPQASGPDQFWELLQRGTCAITDTPPDRWDSSLKADCDKQPGRVTANRGGFLDQIGRFDASFFGISRREAESIDPQQMLLLEVTWETVEHAGLDANQLRGSRTGVFVGICSNDYLHRLSTLDRSRINAYLGTGNAHGVAAGRLSYFMNWQGPSVAVDTACSSSLTALHLAARSLRYDDCDMALVAGVNVILAPDLSVTLSQAGMLSPTGLCHTFDAAADGFVRGEGCGAILLKRLSRAVADGDRIFCLLRGSACNQDGRSNGLTAPNGVSQQAVIRAALTDAHVAPDQVDYLEAHGTGTPLGDPVELNALAAVFAPGRDRKLPLRVGSVKTNVGHLEGAAGIAGVMKVALALHHEQIPAHLHLHAASPHVDWSLPIEVPTSATPWKRSDRVRLAGVSSFGFGGSNAHILLEEAPPIHTACDTVATRRVARRLLTVSAKTPTALRELAARYAEIARGDCSLSDLCHTANAGRCHFEYRLAILAESIQQVAAELQTFAENSGSSMVDKDASNENDFAVHWLFGDSIEYYADAGRELYASHPSFRAELDRCAAALAGYWPRSLPDILWGRNQVSPGDPEILPALFCLQVASAQLWRSWGISPKFVIAHRFGEYAAAYAAGVFTLEDGLRLVSQQAELQRACRNGDQQRQSLISAAQRTRYAPPSCTYISTGNMAGADFDVASAEYWTDRSRQTMDALLADTIRRVIAKSGIDLILEMGIGNSRTVPSECTLLPGLTTGSSEWNTVLENLAWMYRRGATIHWSNVEQGSGRRMTLPTYPFECKPYSLPESSATLNVGHDVCRAERVHPLLGVRLDLGGREVIFETDLSDVSYLSDHRIGLSRVFPASGFMELAMAAGIQVAGETLDVVDLGIHRPISWDDGDSCRLQVIVSASVDGYDCRILRRDRDQWRTAAECRLMRTVPCESTRDAAPDTRIDGMEIDVDEHYRRCLAAGIGYGPAFRGVSKLVAGDRESWGETGTPQDLSLDGYVLHPALLDCCLQVAVGRSANAATRSGCPCRWRAIGCALPRRGKRACGPTCDWTKPTISQFASIFVSPTLTVIGWPRLTVCC